MVAKHSSKILNLFFILIIIFITIITANILNQNDQENKYSLTEATVGIPSNLNPIIQNHNQSEDDIIALAFNGLFKLDNEGKPIVDLAKNWEITPDGRTYTVHLKEPIFWHDGNRLTSEDVSFTISYLRNNLGANQNPTIWNEVEVFFIDKKTIIFHLQEKFAPFLTFLTFPILPKHISTKNYIVNDKFIASNIIGTGPYIMRNLDNSQAYFIRNPSYHHGVPKIKNVELKFFEEKKEILEAINQELFDSSMIMLSSKMSINELSNYKVIKYPMGQSTTLFMNNLIEPFNDIVNRQYIHQLLNNSDFFTNMQRDLSIEIIPGNSIHPALWASQKTSQNKKQFAGHDHDHDHDHAAPDALMLIVPQDKNLYSIAENIKKELSKEHIKINIRKFTNNQNFELELANRNFDFALLNISELPDPDPYYIWHTSQTLLPGFNISGVNDLLLDSFIEQGRMNIDLYERLAIYSKFQARFNEIRPGVVIAHPIYSYITKRKISGPESTIIYNLSHRFNNIHKWEMKMNQG